MNLMSLVGIATGVLMIASALLFYLYGKNFFFRGPPAYVYIVSAGLVFAGGSEIARTYFADFRVVYGGLMVFSAVLVFAGFMAGFYGSNGGGL